MACRKDIGTKSEAYSDPLDTHYNDKNYHYICILRSMEQMPNSQIRNPIMLLMKHLSFFYGIWKIFFRIEVKSQDKDGIKIDRFPKVPLIKHLQMPNSQIESRQHIIFFCGIWKNIFQVRDESLGKGWY